MPDNCGNSPRSLLAIDIAVNLAAGRYAKIEQFLADDFTWSAAGRNDVMTKAELKLQMAILRRNISVKVVTMITMVLAMDRTTTEP